MEALKVHELTWEEFCENRRVHNPIMDRQGRLICSRDWKIDDKEAFRLYNAAYVEAIGAKVPLRPEVIASMNAIKVPMINDGAPTPIAPSVPPAKPANPNPLNAKGKPFTWSFSAIQDFENCPAQYAAKRFYLTHKDDGKSPHLIEGNRVHKALEDRLLKKTPLPADLYELEKFCATFENAPGYMTVESEMAFDRNWKPCGWFDKDCWARGKTDLDILNGNKLNIFDWKTGKEKDGMFQLETFALFKSIYHPEVEHFVPKFIWTKTGNVTPKQVLITKDQIPAIKDKVMEKVNRMEEAWAYENFPARPSGLCNFCIMAHECDHRR